jgi:hypothetical protein
LEPISLLLTALAAGALAGTTKTVDTALSDAYGGLKALISRRFAGQSAAQVALEQHASDPDTWEAPLRKALSESGLEHDSEALAAAQRVLQLVDEPGFSSGKYRLDLRGAQVGNVGDNARVTTYFQAPPGS